MAVRKKVKDLLASAPGEEVLAKGWVRTKRGNKEIAKAFRALEFFKPSIDTNTLNTCLDLLHEVSQSNRYNYMSLLTKAHHSFNELLKDYTKEERKAFFKALNDLSRVLGDAFHRYDTKQK